MKLIQACSPEIKDPVFWNYHQFLLVQYYMYTPLGLLLSHKGFIQPGKKICANFLSVFQ